MRVTRVPALVTAVAALAAVLVGCSGEADEAGVQTVFRSYHAALLARDFVTACALNAPETSEELVRVVNTQGGSAATCEDALSAVYAGPGAVVADGVSRTARIDDVAVDGDSATLTWTFDAPDGSRTVDTGLRRIDGQWRLLALSA